MEPTNQRNIGCNDRDRIFAEGTREEWSAVESHAATCAACAEELRAWRSLSSAAAELRDYSDDPVLWQRIRVSLVEQAEQRAARRSWRSFFPKLTLSWQAAAVSAFALLLLISGAFLLRSPGKD